MTTLRVAKAIGAVTVAFAVSGCESVYSFFDTSPPAAVQTQAVVAPVTAPAPPPAATPAPTQVQSTVTPQTTQPEISPERQLILDDVFGGGDDDSSGGGGGGWSG
ncbi:MAG: hypothetical protein AAGJ28_19055 [Pseudomonadota bacterium]